MWDLPGPGLEPMSPALAGGFLTTVPPGKPWVQVLTPIVLMVSCLKHALCDFTFGPRASSVTQRAWDTEGSPEGGMLEVSVCWGSAQPMMGKCFSQVRYQFLSQS